MDAGHQYHGPPWVWRQSGRLLHSMVMASALIASLLLSDVADEILYCHGFMRICKSRKKHILSTARGYLVLANPV